MIDYYAPNIDLTLLGCGFLANYHLGAIYLLSQVWPHRPFNRICGASCGGLVGVLVASGVPFDRALANSMSIITQLRTMLANPTKTTQWRGVHEMLERLLDKCLPENAHLVCSNRLGVSVTKVWPAENIFAHQFESRQELIDAVAAGCFIPLWSGRLELPRFRGHKCVDGGYTDNDPKFPADTPTGPPVKRLKLCAFASDADVCPPERYGLINFKCLGTRYYLNWPTLRRGARTLVPLDERDYLEYLLDGHRDMKEYILHNQMVRCQQCTWSAAAAPATANDKTSKCVACLRLMEKVDSLEIPQNLIRVIMK